MQIHQPADLNDAIRLLASNDEVRCLAGGQSLVPMLNLGLVDPPALVSLRHVAGLDRIERGEDGSLSIGAMASQAALAAFQATGQHQVLVQAARQMAHPAIRNFGTVGGSLCHADPAADLPPAAVAAGATFSISGPGGAREVAAEDFFVDYLTTALSDAEILTGIAVPAPASNSAGHYYKYARVDGDYATVSVAVSLSADAGVCSGARIVLGSCAQVPLRLDEADAALVGSAVVDGSVDTDAVARAGTMLQQAAEPLDDVRGTAAYRRRLIPGLVARAVARAAAEIGT